MSHRKRLLQAVGLYAALGMIALTACSSSSGSSKAAAPTDVKSARASATSGTGGFSLPVSHPTVWLCRPGMADNPCAAGLDATVISTDGTQITEPFVAAKSPKVDCFYVYPTLSEAKSVAAPLKPEPAAIAVTKSQVARFQSVCRLFVPVYRQLTLLGLTQGISGKAIPNSVQANATADVVSAWHDYLDHDNDGRGVVLLGHSQGAGQLISLLKTEIDRSPAERARLVSAIVLGGNLLVPEGKGVGGDLQSIPACRSAAQHSCVVAYSMFATPPPANSYFGRATVTARNRVGTLTKGMQVLCVNPANLSGGPAALDPYYPTRLLGGSHLTAQAKTSLPNYPTGFVAYPGQLMGTCRNVGGASWLQIDRSKHGTPPGDAPVAQTLGPQWGLHLLDFTADQADLISLVSQQVATWK